MLAQMMIDLQELGCHNINLVTPTPWIPQIIEALSIAQDKGLNLPIVYNCGGYESIETLKLLDGIIDIYMPDIKYGSNENGGRYSKAPNYWDIVRQALKEMHRQVGDLNIENGIAKKGLIIRHLVLPNNLAESRNVFEFIANEISKDSFINVMDQYYPAYRASEFAGLNRRISPEEYRSALRELEKIGLGDYGSK